MKFINKQFAEFKSIFNSDNILQENEEHANIVTAATMINLFWITVFIWILTFFNVFRIGIVIMNKVIITTVILLIIPSVICYIVKGKGKWIKHVLFLSLVVATAIADVWLKYNITLFMILPIILAARYYNKKFTIAMAIATTFAIIISSIIGVYFGEIDLNVYNSIFIT